MTRIDHIIQKLDTKVALTIADQIWLVDELTRLQAALEEIASGENDGDPQELAAVALEGVEEE